MADETPKLADVIEAALTPAGGLWDWAKTLCELEPAVAIRAALAAARLVAGGWGEGTPAELERLRLTLLAIEAAADHPCAACGEEAGHAAQRSRTTLRDKQGQPHQAHHVVVWAAEVASAATRGSTPAAAYALGETFRRATLLTGPGRLIEAVQRGVLDSVLRVGGPIAQHVEGVLSKQREDASQSLRLRLGVGLGSWAATQAAQEASLSLHRFGGPLDDFVRQLGAQEEQVATRAALAAAEHVAPVYAQRIPSGLQMGRVLRTIRAELTGADDPISDNAEITLMRAQRKVRGSTKPPHEALRVGVWALRAAMERDLNHAVEAVCRAAQLSEQAEVVEHIQQELLSWLGFSGPHDPLPVKPPRSWSPTSQPTRPTRSRPAFSANCQAEDSLCAERRKRIGGLRPLKPAGFRGVDEPPPRRAEWRIGHTVRVKPSMEVTHLGEGVVVDLEFVRGTDTVKAALVRFEDGPAEGVWYSVNTLQPLTDLFGSKLH